MSSTQQLEVQVNKIQEKLADAITGVERDRQGVPIIWVKRGRVIDLLRYMRDGDGLEFHFLADLTAYDDVEGPEEEKGRFVVVYQLFSPQFKTRVRVKARVPDGESIPTATVLWNAANWAEREVFDLFGVKFDGHPDLRRILMDVRWVGHPLRKDYYWRKQQLFNDPEPIPQHLLKD